MSVYLLALGAALFFAVGTVVQQHAAAEAPPQDVMSVKLLLWLVRRPVWLLGVVVAGAGNGLSATALGLGSIALVEPLLGVRLLFALPLAALWHRRRVPGRDWVGAAAVVIGLGTFIAAGNPTQPSHSGVPGAHWAVGGSVVVVLALALAAVGRGRRPARRAAALAAGAGLFFGLQAAMTSIAADLVDQPSTLLTSGYPYVILVVAIVATLFLQSAYELAPLSASFPAQVTAEPICGIVLGVTVLDGSIRLDPVALAFEVIGLAVLGAGLITLARSPLVLPRKKAVAVVEISIREQLLVDVAERLCERDVGHPLRVGIDGICGAGKSTFADELVAFVEARGRPVVRLDSDGFHHVRSIRHRRGCDSARGYYEDAYDFDALREHVLVPLGPDGTCHFATRVHDLASDDVVREWATAPSDAVVLFDSTFLQRDELHGQWDEVILLDATTPRATDGVAVRAWQLYCAEHDPRARASIVIDHDDPASPKWVRGRRSEHRADGLAVELPDTGKR